MKFLITASRLFILLLVLTISFPIFSQSLKTYKIDMRFLQDHSQIDIDQQSDDIFSTEREQLPPSDEEAILDFGDKKIKLRLIGSQHDLEDDYYYLKQCISSDQISILTSTLFIEQGDSFHGQTKSDFMKLADVQSSETNILMRNI